MMKNKKGAAGYFILLSIIGVLVGLFLISHGMSGNSLGPAITIAIGIFVVIKEILDIVH